MSPEIVELKTRSEFARAYAVMNELRTHLSEPEYLDLLDEMTPRGYRLFALREGDRIEAVAGVGLGVNLYYGRYLWVFDLVTTEESRSRGFGMALMDHLEALARAEGCVTVALSSRLDRGDAHRFYEQRAGFERTGYTFKKQLR